MELEAKQTMSMGRERSYGMKAGHEELGAGCLRLPSLKGALEEDADLSGMGAEGRKLDSMPIGVCIEGGAGTALMMPYATSCTSALLTYTLRGAT